MNISLFMTFFKGFLIGSTMIIPGISGGSMAMILGIYDKLISSVSSFRKSPLKNILFLAFFALGAGIGILICSNPLSWLLERYPMPTLYFFLGAVFGGIPLIEKKSGIRKISPDVLFYLFIGFIVVIMIAKLPGNLFSDVSSTLPWLLVAGLLASAALVLPGISFSHFLLTLGLYDKLLLAIKSIDLGFLLPLGAGLLLGLVLLTKVLEHWMNKYPKAAYLTILGFVLGSALMIFPGIPKSENIVLCLLLALGGFWGIAFLARLGTGKQNRQ